jgi:cation diffusion facilitator family transporter
VHEGSRRAIFAALFANLGIAVAKVAAAVITGSASMYAESIHSFADTGNQGLLLLGGHRARRAPDTAHPFGYGTERYFWAFVVALVLFTLGALFSLYEGVEKLRHPHELESPAVAFVVLVVAIGLESFSLRTAVREARPHLHGRRWIAFIRTTKNPELPVVLLEDIGALVGLVIALAGLGLAVVTDEPRFDAIGSIGIGVLLAVIAVVLAVEMKSLLVGEGADAETDAAARAAFESAPEVESLIHLRTRHLGPEELLVAAKIQFRAATTAELADAIDAVEAQLRAAVPTARYVYLEPDLRRPDSGAGEVDQGDGVGPSVEHGA